MENGRYPAHPTGNVHVGDHENGCLICNMEFAFDAGGIITNTFWLTTKDGSINTKTIDKLKEIFKWDGADPFWFEDHAAELVEIPVELTVENETYIGKDEQQHTAPKVKYVDPVGGSSGGMKIANSDRKSLMSKYGAKLRAVSGGTPAAKKATPPPAPKQPDLPTPPAVPKKAVLLSDMNACWKALNEAMADKTRAEVEAKWFEIIKDACGDKQQADYDPQDWGAVMAKLKTTFDNLPF